MDSWSFGGAIGNNNKAGKVDEVYHQDRRCIFCVAARELGDGLGVTHSVLQSTQTSVWIIVLT